MVSAALGLNQTRLEALEAFRRKVLQSKEDYPGVLRYPQIKAQQGEQTKLSSCETQMNTMQRNAEKLPAQLEISQESTCEPENQKNRLLNFWKKVLITSKNFLLEIKQIIIPYEGYQEKFDDFSKQIEALHTSAEQLPGQLGSLNSRLNELIEQTPFQVNESIINYIFKLRETIIDSERAAKDRFLCRELMNLSNHLESFLMHIPDTRQKDIPFADWKLEWFENQELLRKCQLSPQREFLLRYLIAKAQEVR